MYLDRIPKTISNTTIGRVYMGAIELFITKQHSELAFKNHNSFVETFVSSV